MAGSFNEVKFDPSDPNTVYAAQAAVGLIRSTTGGGTGSWQTIFSGNRGRYSFSPVRLPNGKTRIYLSDASGGGPSGAQVYRTDDAGQPAATMTARARTPPGRGSRTRPRERPGFAVYNYCNTPLVGSQCTYDMFTVSPADRPDMVVVGGLMHYEELKPYAAPGGMRGNGRAVLMSQDAGATWTDVTGDVGGESMHPDQHAAVFVPGNADQFFVGSDGGVIRSSGKLADASAQCDSRGLSAAFLADCHNWLKRIPTELRVINAGLGTLQMTAIAVSPFTPENEALAGTQDNGTLAYSGKPTWILPLTGDGGDPGYDAVDPNLHFHTYTGGQMDVNYNGNDPTSWLWVGDRFIVNFPESLRFYAPAIPDPNVTKTIFVGAQRVWRTQTAGGDRAFLEAHCNTAVGEFPSDLLYTGACGSPADWSPLGASTLTGTAFGATKSGNNLSSLARSRTAGRCGPATGAGRVLISRNANAAAASVTFTRIDGTLQPDARSRRSTPTRRTRTTRSSRSPATTRRRRRRPATCSTWSSTRSRTLATWTDISFDIGDQPMNDAVLDTADGRHLRLDRLRRARTRAGRRRGSRRQTACRRHRPRADARGGEERRSPALRGDARPQRVPPAVEVAHSLRSMRKAPVTGPFALLCLLVCALVPASAAAPSPTLAQLVGQKLVVSMAGTTPSASLLARARRGEIGGVIVHSWNFPPRPSCGRSRGAAAGGRGRRAASAADRRRPGGRLGEDGPVAAPDPGAGARALERRCARGRPRDRRRAARRRRKHRPGTRRRRSGLAGLGGLPAGRTWSFDSHTTARLATAFAAGLADGHALATMKHFPGLGFATADTDRTVVHITASRAASRRASIHTAARSRPTCR